MIKKLVKNYTEPEYRALPHLSYSRLAGLDYDPSSLNDSTFKKTKSLIYGSAVDCLLFDGQEIFKKNFAILDYNGPTDIIQAVVDEVYDDYINNKDSWFFDENATLKTLKDNVLSTARKLDYGGKNWKDDTIINKIVSEGSDYFDFLKENTGKTMIDAWMYERAINSVYVLQTHEFSKDYIIPKNKDIEIHYQFPIIWKYQGHDCKSLLDILYIDHKNKVIIPVDLKTSYDDVLMFPKSYIKWKYYIQASFYTKAVSYLKLEYPHLFDYKIDNFRFMVISSNDSSRPIIWMTNQKDIMCGEFGGTLRNGETVTGYKELINAYEWHTNENLYKYPKKVYDKKGHLDLNVF